MTMHGIRLLGGGTLVLALWAAPAAAGAEPDTLPGDPSGSSAKPAPPAPVSGCRLPAELPLAEAVADPVFSVLVGLIEADACGILTRARLEREVKRLDRPTRIPVPYLHVVRRVLRTDGPDAEVDLISVADLDLPVPYDILTYHPGRVRASSTLVFEEWVLGTVRIQGEEGGPPIVLEQVRLWGLAEGRLMIDVDGWLDGMMGAKLDDMQVAGFALFRYGKERIGLALGYNPDGVGRSGAFSFREDTVLFPAPLPLKRAGAHLRSRLERLLPSVVALRDGDG